MCPASSSTPVSECLCSKNSLFIKILKKGLFVVVFFLFFIFLYFNMFIFYILKVQVTQAVLELPPRLKRTLNFQCPCFLLLSARISYLYLHPQFVCCGYRVQGFLMFGRCSTGLSSFPSPGKMFYTLEFHCQLHFYDEVNWSLLHES